MKNKGISLIVLVITIIVMIVLSGAIILTLSNNGIIDKASGAVDKTNEATVKELAELGWAEAYMKGAKTIADYELSVKEKLEKNKIDISEYAIKVTKSGVKVVRGWIQDGLTVKKGNTVLTIGDDFNYDETAEGTKNVAWKVLGANDNGELLIMSTSDVESIIYIGDTDNKDLAESQNDWLTGAAQLDKICEPYGKGKSATGVRSIRVEDVNKITGYNPESPKFEAGTLYEYGNEVTYSYNGTTTPQYKGTNGLKGKMLNEFANGFYYYNGTDFVIGDLSTKEGTIITVKSNFYGYNAADLDTIDSNSKAYKMLFGEKAVVWYWLASTYVWPHQWNLEYRYAPCISVLK